MNPPPPAYTAPPGVQQGQSPSLPGPVIYVGASPQQQYPYSQSTRIYANYLSKQSSILGAIMIVSGILCIIFNAVSLGLGGSISPIAYGIWGGIWFIITGSFGVSAARTKTSCKVVTLMVLCIISSVTALVVLILAAIAAGLSSRYSYYYSYSGGYYGSYGYGCPTLYGSYNNTTSTCQAITAMEAMQAILGGIVGIASIWGSVLCCKVACCCQTSTGQVLSQPQFVPVQGNQQVFFYSQQLQGGQYVPYPGSYPIQMQSGYPAPMMINPNVGMAPSGYVNHSMNLQSPESHNPAVGLSQPHDGDFHNTVTVPPNHYDNKV